MRKGDARKSPISCLLVTSSLELEAVQQDGTGGVPAAWLCSASLPSFHSSPFPCLYAGVPRHFPTHTSPSSLAANPPALQTVIYPAANRDELFPSLLKRSEHLGRPPKGILLLALLFVTCCFLSHPRHVRVVLPCVLAWLGCWSRELI